jgi:hypothetical protein
MPTVELLEYSQVTRARKIDEDKGVLYDLVILGPRSANGRDYPEATQRKALRLLEGRQAFANHAPKGSGNPSVYDVIGVWRNCRVEGKKTYGNFHYFKTHPLAPRLVEAARRPELNNALGFSISARGATRHDGSREVVEDIAEVLSIDCVSQPASVAGLYEDIHEGRTTMKLKTLIEKLKARRPAASRLLREAAESGIMSDYGNTDVDVPDDDVESSDGAADEAIKSAFKAAWAALLDDDGLDDAEVLKKARQILAARAKLLDKGTAADDDTTGKMESRRRWTTAGTLTESDAGRKERVSRLRRNAY